MSLDKSERAWHDIYVGLPDSLRWAVDTAFGAATHELRKVGPTSNSDQAEILVAAITRYMVESLREKKEFDARQHTELPA